MTEKDMEQLEEELDFEEIDLDKPFERNSTKRREPKITMEEEKQDNN